MQSTTKRYVKDGDVVTLLVPHSEVCMHMQVAGRVMQVRFRAKPMDGWTSVSAQLMYADGHDFSAPITSGEAGFYYDSADEGYYCYEEQTPPICECEDMQCLQILGITREAWERKRWAEFNGQRVPAGPQLAPTCKTGRQQ